MATSIAVVLAACGGEKVDLGGTDGGGTAESGSDGSGSSSGGGSGDAGGSPLDGTWTGYIESYALPSGSDVLSMTFADQGSGPTTGTVTFGTQPAPPPPTNAAVGYPPSVTDWQTAKGFLGEGFVYTALDLQLASPRVQLGVVSKELWKTWCGLQQPYSGTSNVYGCLPPDWGCGGPGPGCMETNLAGQMVSVDCGQLALCRGAPCEGNIGPVCQCSATSCTVDVTVPDITFDLQLSTGHLDGSMTGLASSVLNIHLTKQ